MNPMVLLIGPLGFFVLHQPRPIDRIGNNDMAPRHDDGEAGAIIASRRPIPCCLGNVFIFGSLGGNFFVLASRWMLSCR